MTTALRRIDTVDGDHQIEAIVRWRHRHGEAHCLARLLVPAPPRTPVAVVSEIRSNPDGRGIIDDFAAVADALLAALPPEYPVDPRPVTWVAHHGAFSYHDAFDPDTFTIVPLRWDGQHYHDERQHRLLGRDEAAAALAGVRLDPVPEALAALGHAH